MTVCNIQELKTVVPAFMENYNNNALPQASNVEACHSSGMLKDALELVKASEITQVAEFGASAGVNSIDICLTICNHLLLNSKTKHIWMHHEDLPQNDWNEFAQLFETHSKSYTRVHPNQTSQTLVGKSFYQRCFPPNSLDFIFSCTAVHWLSQVPCSLSNSTWVHSSHVPQKHKQQWSKSAAMDWETFLTNRSKELKSGGVMMISGPCRVEQSTNTTIVAPTTPGELLRKALITLSEAFTWPFSYQDASIWDTFCLPMYRRTEEEYTHVDFSSIGLELISCKVLTAENPLKTQYLNHKDVNRFVDDYCGYHRAVNSAMIKSGLSRHFPQLDSTEIETSTSVVFSQFRKLFFDQIKASDPWKSVQSFAKDQTNVCLVIVKA